MYAYLQLKMPGPNDTITVHHSAERVLKAEVANTELVETTLAFVELEEINRFVGLSMTTLSRKPKPAIDRDCDRAL